MRLVFDPVYWLICISAAFGFFQGPWWSIPAVALAMTVVSGLSGKQRPERNETAGAAEDTVTGVVGFWFGALAANCAFALCAYGLGYLIQWLLQGFAGT